MTSHHAAIKNHQTELRACRRCPGMVGQPVVGQPVKSSILLVGQAPGHKEIEIHRPFAWTAGKTLFKWFAGIGLDEEQFRQRVYMAAVCRCFPGKNPKGGDRVPDRTEIANCRPWLEQEIELLQPALILPVGKLAISQFVPVNKLNEIIGQQLRLEILGRKTDLIPLPHPSGASTWHRMEPGKTLLQEALTHIAAHRAWQALLR